VQHNNCQRALGSSTGTDAHLFLSVTQEPSDKKGTLTTPMLCHAPLHLRVSVRVGPLSLSCLFSLIPQSIGDRTGDLFVRVLWGHRQEQMRIRVATFLSEGSGVTDRNRCASCLFLSVTLEPSDKCLCHYSLSGAATYRP
jgi:hypothetical protein